MLYLLVSRFYGKCKTMVIVFQDLVLSLESLLSEDEDDDEFYDCIDGPANTSSSEEESSKRMKPEGRLAAHPDLFLLSDGVTPVYIPFTQEVAPMTEDAMHDHLEKLVATDDDEGGQAVRVKLQSVALVSDMSAFKVSRSRWEMSFHV